MKIALLAAGGPGEVRLFLALAIGRATPACLAQEIRDMTTDESMRRRAAALGGKIRGENGLLHASVWVEKRLPDAPVFSNGPG
mgnify:CR=1 FL=1|jgi:hypothetical protein